MTHCKIYGHRSFIDVSREVISDSVHRAAVSAFGLPEEKKFHRFFALDGADFITPADRSAQYLVIEVHLFEGRSVAAKKNYYNAVQSKLDEALGLDAIDLEILLIETPRHDWFIRGLPGDELPLPYAVGDETQ